MKRISKENKKAIQKMMQKQNGTYNSALDGIKAMQPTDKVSQELHFEEDFKRLKSVWNKQNDISADVNWNKIFAKRRPKFYYRYLLIWKCVLLCCYLLFIAELLQYLTVSILSVWIIPYIVVFLICIVNVWWFSLYIKRILQTDIYKDTALELHEKKATLSLMERYEWFGALILVPVYLLTYIPLVHHVYENSTWHDTLIYIRDNMSIWLIGILAGYIYYLINRKAITKLQKETNKLYKVFNVRLFRSW